MSAVAGFGALAHSGWVKALAPGFLLAMPQLQDPNFQRAVVLMLEHGEGGTMGLVINRPSSLSLGDVGQEQSLRVSRLRALESAFAGGPVEPQRGFVLHDRADVRERQELLPGLFLSLTLESLGPLLEEERGRVRFCMGYAGWGPRQLEAEMAEGTWLFSEASAEAVLGRPPELLWEETLRRMGVEPAMLQPGRGVH